MSGPIRIVLAAAALAIPVAIILMSPAPPAAAQYVGGGSIGAAGGAGGSCDIADVCALTGGADCEFVGGEGPRSASNQDLPITAQGTGSVRLKSGDNTNELLDSSGNVDGSMRTRSGGGGALFVAGTAGFGGTTGYATHGTISAATDSSAVDCVIESLDVDAGGTYHKCIYGGGLTATFTAQTCNCGTTGTPNTVTCDITSDVVYLTDGDADACTVTLGETTAGSIAHDLGEVTIIVTSLGGGGAYTIADSSGVIELAGGASWVGASTGDTLSVVYTVGGSLNTWLETGRALK